MTLYWPWRANSGLLTRNWFKALFSKPLLLAAAQKKSLLQDAHCWDTILNSLVAAFWSWILPRRRNVFTTEWHLAPKGSEGTSSIIVYHTYVELWASAHHVQTYPVSRWADFCLQNQRARSTNPQIKIEFLTWSEKNSVGYLGIIWYLQALENFYKELIAEWLLFMPSITSWSHCHWIFN